MAVLDRSNVVYGRINWRDWTNTSTPLNAHNLNKIDEAIARHDSELLTLDVNKADVDDLKGFISSISYNTQTGIWTITKADGSRVEFDQNIEKIPADFYMTPEGIIVMTTDDGSKFEADIRQILKTVIFSSSDTVHFVDSYTTDGINVITAYVNDGSISGRHLSPTFLQEILEQDIITSLENHYTEFTIYIDGKVEQMFNRVDELEADNANTIRIIQADVDQFKSDINTEIDRFESEYTQKYDEFTNEIISICERHRQDMDDKINDYMSVVNAKLDAIYEVADDIDRKYDEQKVARETIIETNLRFNSLKQDYDFLKKQIIDEEVINTKSFDVVLQQNGNDETISIFGSKVSIDDDNESINLPGVISDDSQELMMVDPSSSADYETLRNLIREYMVKFNNLVQELIDKGIIDG